MRILIISTHDSRGGAGKAAYRFAKEYIKQGHEVCLYVRGAKEKDSFIKTSNTPKFISKIFHILDFVPGYILSGFNKEPQFTLGLFGESLNGIVDEFKPDVINIHWTWKGFISFPEICRISRKVPVVWTMHDYSPFASGVFYPYPEDTHFPLVKLLAGLNSKVRKNSIKNSNISFVSPSEYLKSEFNRISNFDKKDVVTINNGIDVNIFKKLDKRECRKKYGLEEGKKYILFGAINLIDNQVKGGACLKESLKNIEEYLIKNNIGLVSFGSQDPSEFLDLNVDHKFVGYVGSEDGMARLYSACDVMLVPSKQENYPFVVLESLACGTPTVAFNIGGIKEMIESRRNGYLVEPFDTNAFGEGIKYLLENELHFEDTQRFNIEKKAKEYIDLFTSHTKPHNQQ